MVGDGNETVSTPRFSGTFCRQSLLICHNGGKKGEVGGKPAQSYPPPLQEQGAPQMPLTEEM